MHVIHASGSRAVGRVISGVCDSVCLCMPVRALKGIRLKLSTDISHDRP